MYNRKLVMQSRLLNPFQIYCINIMLQTLILYNISINFIFIILETLYIFNSKQTFLQPINTKMHCIVDT